MRRISLMMLLAAVATMAVPSAFADRAADYKVKCQMCHGANGSGDTPAGKKFGAKDLRSPETKKKTDKDLQTAIRDGKNKMPGFKDKLTAEQVEDLVKFIREMAK